MDYWPVGLVAGTCHSGHLSPNDAAVKAKAVFSDTNKVHTARTGVCGEIIEGSECIKGTDSYKCDKAVWKHDQTYRLKGKGFDVGGIGGCETK